MRQIKTYLNLLAISCMICVNAQDNNSSMLEAINKGKSDLQEVIAKTGEQFNFGINANDVKNSRPASAVPYREINIDRLLDYNQQGINGLLNPELKKIVPLMKGNTVLTTVGISDKKQGRYQVTDLINHQYHNELNQLPEEAKQNNFRDLKIVYVPNLNTTVYTANGKSYTSYKGRSLRESIDTEELLQILKRDAIEFERKYGNQIRDGKLLN